MSGYSHDDICRMFGMPTHIPAKPAGTLFTPEQAERMAAQVEREFLGDVEHWRPTGIPVTELSAASRTIRVVAHAHVSPQRGIFDPELADPEHRP